MINMDIRDYSFNEPKEYMAVRNSDIYAAAKEQIGEDIKGKLWSLAEMFSVREKLRKESGETLDDSEDYLYAKILEELDRGRSALDMYSNYVSRGSSVFSFLRGSRLIRQSILGGVKNATLSDVAEMLYMDILYSLSKCIER